MGTPRLLAASLLALGLLLFSGAAHAPAQTGDDPPDEELVETGRELYVASCASCHGPDGEGTRYGPTLVGVGAAAFDFQLRTGRMPLASGLDGQAQRKPPAFSRQQIDALIEFYRADLDGGPEIPEIRYDEELLSRGHQLFVANCVPCHGATMQGGAVGGGALAPSLYESEPVEVAEATITGPGQMPVFDLPPDDLDAVTTYVDYLRRAPSPGGFSAGGLGPVPEGFVAWTVGIGLTLAIVLLVGRPWQRTGR